MDDGLQDLAKIVKETANKVFDDDEIGNCTYCTIIEEGYDDIDDILDDLINYHDCNIISITCKKLMYIMNEQDKYKLYRILIQIYRENVTDVDIFSLMMNQPNHHQNNDQFIDIMVSVIKKLNQKLSLKDQTIIKITNATQLFRNETDLNEYSLSVITSTKFCEKAKKYGIPAAKGKKILNDIRSYFHKQQNEKKKVSVIYQYRYQWNIGSKCEIYSKSIKKWCKGNILNIFKDDEGEWLRVRYCINHKINNYKQKSIQRYNEDIRPIQVISQKMNKRRKSLDNSNNIGYNASYDTKWKCQQCGFLNNSDSAM